MPPLLKRLLLRAAADGEGNDLSGGADYGDDFTPTSDDAVEK